MPYGLVSVKVRTQVFRAIAIYEPGVDYFNEVSSVYATPARYAP